MVDFSELDADSKVDRRRKERRKPETGVDAAGGDGNGVATQKPKASRRKVERRRQIDPTTCERDYTQDEIEFMNALDQYKRDNGRMFPTCSEILEVVRNLGYAKQTDTGESSSQPVEENAEEAPPEDGGLAD